MDRVLIIDYKVQIRELCLELKSRGLQTIVIQRVRNSIQICLDYSPDIIILDPRILHNGVGEELVSSLGLRAQRVPIVIYTNILVIEPYVSWFENGADDIIPKSFGVKEIVSRVRSILRRSPKRIEELLLTHGNLEINLKTQQVFKNGGLIKVTRTEFVLLVELLKNKEQTVSKNALATHVWPHRDTYDIDYNILRVYLSTLRSKIQDDTLNSCKIISNRGLGYFLTCKS